MWQTFCCSGLVGFYTDSLFVFVCQQIFIKEVANEGDEMELDELTNSKSKKQKIVDLPAASHQPPTHIKANAASPTNTNTPPTPTEGGELKPEKNGDTKDVLVEVPKVAKAFQTQALPNGKTQTSVKTLMSKRKISQQKEKKATQMLAIVLGESWPFVVAKLPIVLNPVS